MLRCLVVYKIYIITILTYYVDVVSTDKRTRRHASTTRILEMMLMLMLMLMLLQIVVVVRLPFSAAAGVVSSAVLPLNP